MTATSTWNKWWSRFATVVALAVVVTFLVVLPVGTAFLGNLWLLSLYLLTPLLVIVAYYMRDAFSPWLEDVLELLGEQIPLIRIVDAEEERHAHNREVVAAMGQTLDLYGLGTLDAGTARELETRRYLTPARLARKTAGAIGADRVNPDALELLYREDHGLPTRTLFESARSIATSELPERLCERLSPALAPMPVEVAEIEPLLEAMRDFDVGLLISELKEIGVLWTQSLRFDAFQDAEGLGHAQPDSAAAIVEFAARHRRLPTDPDTMFRLDDGDLAYQWLLGRSRGKDEPQRHFALGCFLVCAGRSGEALLERTCREATVNDGAATSIARALVARNEGGSGPPAKPVPLATLFSTWPQLGADPEAVARAEASLRMGIWPDPAAEAHQRKQDATLQQLIERYDAGDGEMLGQILQLLRERGEQPATVVAAVERARELVDDALSRRLDDVEHIAAAVFAKSGTSDLPARTTAIERRMIGVEETARGLLIAVERLERIPPMKLDTVARADAVAGLRKALGTLQQRVGVPAQRGALASLRAKLDQMYQRVGRLPDAEAGEALRTSLAEVHAAVERLMDRLDGRVEPPDGAGLEAYLVTFDEYSGPVADLIDCLAEPVTADQATFLHMELDVLDPTTYCFGKYTRYTRLGIVPPGMAFEQWQELFHEDLQKVFERRREVLAAAGTHMVAPDAVTTLSLEGLAEDIEITEEPLHGTLGPVEAGPPATVDYHPPELGLVPDESPGGSRPTRDHFTYTHSGQTKTIALALRRDFSRIEVTVERIDLYNSHELHFSDPDIENYLRQPLSIREVWNAVEGKLDAPSRAEFDRLVARIAGEAA